jgi:hypothetical protein
MDWIASGGVDLTMYRNTANLLKEGEDSWRCRVGKSRRNSRGEEMWLRRGSAPAEGPTAQKSHLILVITHSSRFSGCQPKRTGEVQEQIELKITLKCLVASLCKSCVAIPCPSAAHPLSHDLIGRRMPGGDPGSRAGISHGHSRVLDCEGSDRRRKPTSMYMDGLDLGDSPDAGHCEQSGMT